MSLDLPAHLIESAFIQYQETPEKRSQALLELREGILKLPEEERLKDLSDENLIRFVRNRKYDISRAIETTRNIKKFYQKHEDLVCGLDGNSFNLIDQFHGIRIVKGMDKTQDGKTILMVTSAKIVPMITDEFKKKNPKALLRNIIWIMDRISRDPDCQVNGIICMLSCNGMGFFDLLSVATVLSIEDRKIALKHMSTLGIRMKGLFAFEAPLVLKGIFAIIKPFLSAKLSSRINLLGSDYASVIPPLIGEEGFKQCPSAFGGEGGEDIAFDPEMKVKCSDINFVWDP
jgi:hypothetical protein